MIPGVVDVQPAALPGAYNATFGNGQSMLIHGPSAEQLYSRYQASAPQRGLPSGATAQNDANQSTPEQNQSVPDAPVQMGVEPNQSVAPPERTGTTVAMAPRGGQTEQPTPEEEAAGTSMRGAHPPAERAEDVGSQRAGAGKSGIGDPLGYSMKAIDPTTGKEVEGPAVMTADGPRVYMSAKPGKAAGLTGIGKSFMGHAGEAEQQITEARASEQAAAARGSELAQQQATEENAFAKEQQKQAEIQAHEQEEENRQLQAHVQELDSKYQAARDEYKNAHVDSGRLMRGNWLAALGMALGAMGASMGHHANFAAEFVNNNIDRDIRAQEKEIEIKKDAANNALLELSRSQGSLQAGKLAMRQILLEKAQNQAQAIAASYKAPTLQAAAQQAAASLAEQHAQLDLQRKQSYVDKAMHDRVYYSPGSAGRSAGVLVPTQASMAGRQEAQLKGREMALKENKAAAAQAQGAGAIPRGLVQNASAANSTLMLARGLLKDYGVKEGQDVDRGEGWGIGLSRDVSGKTARDIESNLGTLFDEHYKMITGNGPTTADKEEFQHKVSGWSTAQKINFINNSIEQAKDKQRYIESQRGKGEPIGSNVEGEPQQ